MKHLYVDDDVHKQARINAADQDYTHLKDYIRDLVMNDE